LVEAGRLRPVDRSACFRSAVWPGRSTRWLRGARGAGKVLVARGMKQAELVRYLGHQRPGDYSDARFRPANADFLSFAGGIRPKSLLPYGAHEGSGSSDGRFCGDACLQRSRFTRLYFDFGSGSSP